MSTIGSTESDAKGSAPETLSVRTEGPVVFADLAAPPMNLLGPEMVRDLVALIERTEPDDALKVDAITLAAADDFRALARMLDDLADA